LFQKLRTGVFGFASFPAKRSEFGGVRVPVKIRIPDAWEGRVHSEVVRSMLQGWFQRPYLLPPDPGPGRARVSLNLPRRAVKVLEGLSGESPSVALRRLIAAHVPTLPAPRYARPFAALLEPRQVGFVSPVTDARLILRSPVWDAATGRWIPGVASRPVAMPDHAVEAKRAMQSELSFWFWLAVGAVVLWALWKYVGTGVSGVAESASIAEELPRFTEWIPSGL